MPKVYQMTQMTKTVINSIVCTAFLVFLVIIPVSANAARCKGSCHLSSAACCKISVSEKNLVLLQLNKNEKAQTQVFKCFGFLDLEEVQDIAAEQKLKDAVLSDEKEVRTSSLLLADSLASLSKVYEKQGNLEQATVFAMRALKIREKVLALTLADSLEDDARHYRKLSRITDAVRNEQRAMKIRENEDE
jgi:tetratricopeptide (TPR) repeat protein